MVHAISFNIMLEGREIIIVLQNTHYLAQLISEGVRLAMTNYMNQVWINNVLHSVAPNMTANLTQTMGGGGMEPSTTLCSNKHNSNDGNSLLHTRDCNEYQPNLHPLECICSPATNFKCSQHIEYALPRTTTPSNAPKSRSNGTRNEGIDGSCQLNTTKPSRRFKPRRSKIFSIHVDARAEADCLMSNGTLQLHNGHNLTCTPKILVQT